MLKVAVIKAVLIHICIVLLVSYCIYTYLLFIYHMQNSELDYFLNSLLYILIFLFFFHENKTCL